MPKMKTVQAAAKRFKKTASGKYKRYGAFATHLMTGKSSKRRRNLRRAKMVSQSNAKKVAHMLPYA